MKAFDIGPGVGCGITESLIKQGNSETVWIV
jgi:hypothetical protein